MRSRNKKEFLINLKQLEVDFGLTSHTETALEGKFEYVDKYIPEKNDVLIPTVFDVFRIKKNSKENMKIKYMKSYLSITNNFMSVSATTSELPSQP